MIFEFPMVDSNMSEDEAGSILDDFCNEICCCDCPYFEEINYSETEYQSCLDYFMAHEFLPEWR